MSQAVIIAAVVEVGRVDAAMSPGCSNVSKVYALIDYKMMMHRLLAILSYGNIFEFQGSSFIFFLMDKRKADRSFLAASGLSALFSGL